MAVRNGQPIRCIVTCDHADTRRTLINTLNNYHAIKRECESGELFVQIPNKHQNFLETLGRMPHTKVKIIESFPFSEEDQYDVEDDDLEPLFVRDYSERQKERKRREREIREMLERERICGIPLREIREFAEISSKGEFLKSFGIEAREFNAEIIALSERLEQKFGHEVDLNIYFTYECSRCNQAFIGQHALREYRKHNLSRHCS